MSNQNSNEINNEDISKIQDEIDNLEQKLFSDNSNANISLNKFNLSSESKNNDSFHLNSNNITNKEFNIDKRTDEKINEKSYKFFNDNIIQNNNEKKGNDIIKIIENDDSDKSNMKDISKQKEKIRELIELQKEIDKLRQERSKKINNKLNKLYNNNTKKDINKKEKNKFKNINKK